MIVTALADQVFDTRESGHARSRLRHRIGWIEVVQNACVCGACHVELIAVWSGNQNVIAESTSKGSGQESSVSILKAVVTNATSESFHV